jgi:hypothetical protein
VDARSILGLRQVRAAFLVHLPAAEPRENEAGAGREAGIDGETHLGDRLMNRTLNRRRILEPAFRLDDDDPDDEVDDEDDLEDDDEDDGEDEEDDEDEPETWQV